ncbi:carbohydrate sulfotransferase 15 [Elysia marginata]|uniref:Carbohydrate sulfotransferase 15 n=1 Tax=Elysia marginata TaxID=1093978 RepID=A0AAV4IVA9_9GAST|nr:carbohydrate sulfotransferase 15 [Elysia marginata]
MDEGPEKLVGSGEEGDQKAEISHHLWRTAALGKQTGTGSGETAAVKPSDDGQFDLRQFVNSASRFPLEEDFRSTPAQTTFGYGGAVTGGGGGGGDGGGGQGEGTDLGGHAPPPRERETLEICDLPAQLVRSVMSGAILGAMIAGIQALLLWVLETMAVWTPRAVEFACRLTAVHLPVLCGGVRDWTTTSAPRLASRAWHVVRVTAPHKISLAYHTVATEWWPAAQAWARYIWAGLVAAVTLAWSWLQRLAAVRSILSHTLGLLVQALHRCYNFLMIRFRARFPDAFEWMVGAVGACERRCMPVLTGARLRVTAAWHALLTAILTLVDKVKAVLTGGARAPSSAGLAGAEQGGAESETSGGTTLEGIVLFAASCGRGFRGSTRLRCMSPLKHRLRRVTPISGFLAILLLCGLGFICTTLLVYSGSRVVLKPREKPQPVDWQEYIHASRRPRLDGELIHKASLSEGEDAVDEMRAIEREEGRRNRLKKLGHGGKGRDGEGDWDLEDVGWKQVSDVIGLMAKKTDSNATTRPVIHKKVLMGQIQLLRDAMMDEKSRLPVLEKPPTCVGDAKSGEVEDILCIPRPKFLSHVKNPCWYTGPRTSEDSVPELKCLPYFHILGCAKSGTTDLWNRLMSHPHVISNDGLLHKEALWWSWQRYGIMGYKQRHVMTFEDYVDLFQDTARQIRASMESETLHQQILITGGKRRREGVKGSFHGVSYPFQSHVSDFSLQSSNVCPVL